MCSRYVLAIVSTLLIAVLVIACNNNKQVNIQTDLKEKEVIARAAMMTNPIFLESQSAKLDDFFEQNNISSSADINVLIQIANKDVKEKYESIFRTKLPDNDFNDTFIIVSLCKQLEKSIAYYHDEYSDGTYKFNDISVIYQDGYSKNTIYCYSMDKALWDEVLIIK